MNNSTVSPSIAPSLWDPPFPAWFLVCLFGVMTLASLETIAGNALVLLSYRNDRVIRKQISNRYIVSLAVSDLVIGFEGFPFFTAYVANGERWPLGPLACHTWLFLDYTLCLVSILTVLLITIDRYMSVCHTAKYLKWQSPTKTQWVIYASWGAPAVFFGVMIFGWEAIIDPEEHKDPTICVAPFLRNPYVNMGMYFAYYWTTLVAMLLLYRGIHNTARNLERKGEARERRNIAILLAQRCGAQVGVTLVMQSQAHKSPEKAALDVPAVQHDAPESGYATGTTCTASCNALVPQISCTQSTSVCTTHGGNTPIPEEEDLPTSVEELEPVEKAMTDAKRFVHQMESIDSMDLYDEAASLLSGFLEENLGSLFSLIERDDSINNSRCVSRVAMRADGCARTSAKCHRSPTLKTATVACASLSPSRKPLAKRSISNPSTVCLGASPSVHQGADEQLKRANQLKVLLSEQLQRARTIDFDPRSGGPSDFSSDTDDRSTSSPSVKTKASHPIVPLVEVQQYETAEELADNSQHANTGGTGFLATAAAPKESPTTPNEQELADASKQAQKVDPSEQKVSVLSSIFNPVQILRRHRRKTRAERRAHKAFRTITIIVGFFALFWSPYFIVATVFGFCPSCIPSAIFVVSYYMCYFNSAGNPFAYALANRQFKAAFLRLLRGDFHRQA